MHLTKPLRTQALSDVAVKALEGRKACLLANHGQIAVGENLKQALSMALEVETLCEVYGVSYPSASRLC